MRFGNNPREALQEFNLARGDSNWGTEAVYNMVEIYLDPDDTNMWEEADTGAVDNSDMVRDATKLLAEALQAILTLTLTLILSLILTLNQTTRRGTLSHSHNAKTETNPELL